MSNNKFTSQTNYEFDLDTTLSKIRLDFDTNVTNPNGSILGLDSDNIGFVLLDQSLLGGSGSNLKTTTTTQELNVKTYVFEKTVDPSVVGCENCGSSAKYFPTGVAISASGSVLKGDITDPDVLPIINKEVIAEFEIQPEAYHSLEIDLIGNRKICDDSGNCFTENLSTSKTELEKGASGDANKISWIARAFYGTTFPTATLDANKTSSRTLSTANSSLSSKTLKDSSLISDVVSTYKPPFNMGPPSVMMSDEISISHHNMIDYSCCRCCDYFADTSLTLSQKKQLCEETNVYNVSVVDGSFPFWLYCTGAFGGRGKDYLEYGSDAFLPTSICQLINSKKTQYGHYPNTDIPQCLIGTYSGLDSLPFNRSSLIDNVNKQNGVIDTVQFLTPGAGGDVDIPMNSCGDWDVPSNIDCTSAFPDPNWSPCCFNSTTISCCGGGGGGDGGGGGGDSSGQNAVRHCRDIFDSQFNAFSDTFILGRCKDYPDPQDPTQPVPSQVDAATDHVYKFQSDWCAIVPKSYGTPTADFTNGSETASISSQNYCYLTINDFDTADTSKQNLLGLFDDIPWLTMGGHFYAHNNLRNFIDKQSGTIHFSTSVNSNFLSYLPFMIGDPTTQLSGSGYGTIYHIENIRANGREYRLNYSYKPTAPSFYKSGSAYLSIGLGYNSNANPSNPGNGNDSYPIVKKYTFHNLRTEGGYQSEYRTSNEPFDFSISKTDESIVTSNSNLPDLNNELEIEYAVSEGDTYSITSSVTDYPPQLQFFGVLPLTDGAPTGIWDGAGLHTTDDSLIILKSDSGIECFNRTGPHSPNICVDPSNEGTDDDTRVPRIIATSKFDIGTPQTLSLSKAFANEPMIRRIHGRSTPIVAVTDVDDDGFNHIICWQGALAAATMTDANQVIGDCKNKKGIQAIGVGDGFVVAVMNKDDTGIFTLESWGDSSDGVFPTSLIENTLKDGSSDFKFVNHISCGMKHCVAIFSNNKIVAWGKNDFGQSSVPAGISGNVINLSSSISSGDQHSCAVLGNGTVVCWGRNDSGQCSGTDISGNPITSTSKTTNTPVTILGTTLQNVSSIKCSGSTTIATKQDGTVVVWGFDASGGIPSGTKSVHVEAIGGKIVILSDVIPNLNPTSTLAPTTRSFITGQLKNKWPLSDQFDSYISTGRQSFRLTPNSETSNPLVGTPGGKLVDTDSKLLQFNNLYYNGITQTNIITSKGIKRSFARMHYVFTYKEYLINNSIPQAFTYITDARDFQTQAGVSFENYKFEVKFIDDTTLEISDNGSTRIFNSNDVLTTDKPANTLNLLFTNPNQLYFDPTTKAEFAPRASNAGDSLHLPINAYLGTVSGTPGTLTLNKTKEVLDHGTTISSFTTTGTPGQTNFTLKINLDRPFTRYNSDTSLPAPNTNGTVKYFITIKVKKNIKGFTDSSTYDRTSLFSRKNDQYRFENYSTWNSRTNGSDQIDEGANIQVQAFIPPSSGDSRFENFLYKNEIRLFSINSSRFATPDYASYDAGVYVKKMAEFDELVIPMRGLQYSFHKKKPNKETGVLSEVDDYPIIRTVRKNDGKFYIQILAGAFPYYHPLIHEPMLKKLGILGNMDLFWRNQICRKSPQWFNYVSTTKWTCVVKHTQVSTNLFDWQQALPSLTNSGGTSTKPIVVGRNPSTAEIVVPVVPVGSGIKPDQRESLSERFGGPGPNVAID